MYDYFPSFVIRFHGCDQSVKDRILKSGERPEPSMNDYDWLGSGFYCWEQNELRAKRSETAASLYKKVGVTGEGIAIWTQPLGASDAYQIGDIVSHGGKTWESDVANNVWEPGVYGWTARP